MPIIPTIEDWRGITNPATRRKLQNRLNQREHRRRRRENPGVQRREEEQQRNAHPDSLRAVGRTSSGAQADLASIINSSEIKRHNPRFHASLVRLIAEAQIAYALGAQMSHHLPAVIGLNVFGAFAHNCALIGLDLGMLWEDVPSPFCPPLPALPQGVKMVPRLPPALMPTEIQKRVPHHPWIDLLPLPGIRDNVLLRLDQVGEDLFEEQEEGLCADMTCCVGRGDPIEVEEDSIFQNLSRDKSLVVWGDPWDSKAWEVSEGFASKHAWTLKGCKDLMESTNFWRAKRGEKPVVWEIDDE